MVAEATPAVFSEAWDDDVKAGGVRRLGMGNAELPVRRRIVPKTSITFSPHDEEFAGEILDGIGAADRRGGQESTKTGSVLFAVMESGQAGG